MHKKHPPLKKSSLLVSDIETYIAGWILDCEARDLSVRTLESRRSVLAKFLWYAEKMEWDHIGSNHIRLFLKYVSEGHKEEEGRWGGKWNNTRPKQPVTASTVQTYHRILRTFFYWCMEEAGIDETPMANVGAPTARSPQIQPFTDAQVKQLLAATRKTKQPYRDLSLVYLFCDTGIRESELCNITLSDVNFTTRQIKIQGKGDKIRYVQFGAKCGKALWQYIQQEGREPDQRVFLADNGKHQGQPLTRSGVYRIFTRLEKTANITGVRCSPHTARHYFAITFLRNGGNQFTLQTILGHESLEMTKKYVAIAQADMTAQHKKYSPMDRLL
jgi:site-specific recombinase XerD